jgi:hypothetical protein
MKKLASALEKMPSHPAQAQSVAMSGFPMVLFHVLPISQGQMRLVHLSRP